MMADDHIITPDLACYATWAMTTLATGLSIYLSNQKGGTH